MWEAEDGEVRRVTYRGAPRADATGWRNGLRSLGVGQRDAVGIFMPMAIETVAAVMACSKLGAIWVPIFSGFGPEAVAARLADAGAKVLITADGTVRRGQSGADEGDRGSCRGRRRAASSASWSWSPARRTTTSPLERRARRPVGGAASRRSPDASTPSRSTASTRCSSATPAGRPAGRRASLHVHGGFLVKVAEEVAYQADISPGDVLYWVTDLGWIMGPWEIVGALALGATVVLFEGAPELSRARPAVGDGRAPRRHDARRLADADPRADPAAATEPGRAHDLSSLRVLARPASRGTPSPYRWLLEEVGGGRCPIINISGGTEVGACFLSPLPITDLKPCTLRGPALGDGRRRLGSDGTAGPAGEVGELVCKQPWPAHDARRLGRPRAVPGDVLAPVPRRLGARRLGEHRRGRVLVPARAVRRHAEDRRQAAGAGRGRERAVVASGRGRVGRGRRPDEVKGEAIWCFVVAKPGVDDRADASRTLVADQLGKSFAPSKRALRRRAPQDAERQDRPPARSGRRRPARIPGTCRAWRTLRRSTGSERSSSLDDPDQVAFGILELVPIERQASAIRLVQLHPFGRPSRGSPVAAEPLDPLHRGLHVVHLDRRGRRHPSRGSGR